MAANLDFDVTTIDRLADRFERIADEGDDQTGVLDEIGAYLEFSIDRRFELEQGPGGIPWAPTHRGHSILKGSPPRLRSSFSRRVGNDRVTVGTNLIYAGVHQDGATIRPRQSRFLVFTIGNRIFFLTSVTIPARPFLGIDAADEIEIGEIVSDYVRDLVGGNLQ